MPERKKNKLLVFVLALSLGILPIFAPVAQAQQTLGGVTGTVMESTGSVLPGTLVTIVGDETLLPARSHDGAFRVLLRQRETRRRAASRPEKTDWETW